MPFWAQRLKREFDAKPIAAHLYVTDRCNLDCSYCTEYDNSRSHPKLSDLKLWIDKIRQLGCIRIGIQGGEPLSHPDIVEIVDYCKNLNLKTTMSTNGFLLTPKLVDDLRHTGLDGLQISVDRMAPIASTRKALKTLLPKIEFLVRSGITFNLSGVLFGDTVDEAHELIRFGLSKGISTHARLVHAAANGKFDVHPGEKERLEAAVDFQIHEKQGGRKIHTSWRILDYQKSLIHNRAVEWTCLAGYKYFFVSARGKFWLCSSNRTPDLDLMAVTPDILAGYFHKKPCQQGCGVYCIVSESLSSSHRGRYVKERLGDAIRSAAGRQRQNAQG